MSQHVLSEVMAALQRIDTRCTCGTEIKEEVAIIRNQLLQIGAALASRTTGDKVAIGPGSTAVETIMNTVADCNVTNVVQASRIDKVTGI